MKRRPLPALMLLFFGSSSIVANAAEGAGDAASSSAHVEASANIDFAAVESMLIPTADDIEFATLASAESGIGKPSEDILVENALVLLANEVARIYPDDYATASVTDGALSIGFRDTAPDGLAEQIRQHGLEVTFETGLGTSERAINAALIDAFDQLVKLPGVVDASGGYDVDRRSLDLVVVTQQSRSAAALAEALDVPDQYTVNVDVASGPLGADHTVNGGGRLEVSGSAELACTTGIGITKGAQRGIVTAGHCSNSNLTYEDWTGQPETAVGARDAEYIDNLGDMQIHLFAATSTDNFYYTTSRKLRDVTGVQSPVNGITLCRFGLNSGLECDEVYAQGHCKVVEGNRAKRTGCSLHATCSPERATSTSPSVEPFALAS